MNTIRGLFTAAFLFTSVLLQAQFTVAGRVVDSATKEPLRGASVFCQNTTIGTTTGKDGEFSLSLKAGGYELIISFTGYQTQQLRVSNGDGRLPDIELVKEEKSLGEVFIKSNNEVKDGWEKYGNFFTEHFIGATPNAVSCKFLNPEVLKFYFLKKSNKLRVMATEPLQIDNQALGYKMSYMLDSFVYYYNTDLSLYRGYCLYSEKEGSDSLKRKWAAAREKVYYGSRLHFMRAYYDSAVTQEGFSIGILNEQDDKEFNLVADVYDTTYYGALDSTMQIEIWYPRKISISYGQKPEPEYLKKFHLPKNVAAQISYIEMKDGIAIRENGYYYDQKDFITQGYWSWKNLADQLPYDYTP